MKNIYHEKKRNKPKQTRIMITNLNALYDKDKTLSILIAYCDENNETVQINREC